MTLDPKVMKAVEALNYRASVGDVAAQAGLRIPFAEQGLLALASEVGGSLQVADSGDIAYCFPKNFRSILFSKSWKLRLKALLGKVWNVLFYIIRISFGIALLSSIGILAIALILLSVAALAALSGGDDDRGGGSSFDLGGLFYILSDLLSSALRLFFYADWLGYGGYGSYGSSYGRRGSSRRSSFSARAPKPKSELNFLESIFSFLFGDGRPNDNLEERRWQAVAAVIRENQGAIAAEQITPFLDPPTSEPDEAVLPALVQFQGQPLVSPQGEIIYQFPELQVTAATRAASLRGDRIVPTYLKEHPWRFSKATISQLWAAGLLGGVNAGLAVVIGLQLPNLTASGIGFLSFVSQIYPLLLLYGLSFLIIPLIRWQAVRWRDRGVQRRNQQRQDLARQLQRPDSALRSKLDYAQQFALQKQLKSENAVYTTEQSLLDQEISQQERDDAEWQRRLKADLE